MYKKVILSSLVLMSSSLSSFSYANTPTPLSDLVAGKNEWLYSALREKEEKIFSQIEADLNRKFQKDVLGPLTDKAIDILGGEFEESITAFASFVPYLSFATFLAGTSGPSETELMLEIILAEMRIMKEEIINAIGESFDDETEALLDALILELDLYNGRDDLGRLATFQSLDRLSFTASNIKKRLEKRDQVAIDKSHLYMLVSTLHFEIQREYTRWLTVDKSPNATDGAISQKINTTFKTLLSDNVSYINNGPIGDLGYWRESFDDSFGDVKFIKTQTEVVGKKVCRGRPGRQTCSTPKIKYRYYEYTINNGDPVEVKAYQLSNGRCGRGIESTYSFQVEGILSGGVGIDCGRDLDKKIGEAAKDLHQADDASFAKYVSIGYEPIAEMLDSWWAKLNTGARPRNEVDNFLRDNL